jgi:sulfate permease, SulP family
VLTAVVVCVVGVEQGIIVAIVASIIDLVRRQYSPRKFVLNISGDGVPTYQKAEPGSQSEPGLIVFRYDAELFYANANRFVTDVQGLVEGAPDPVEWLILDAGSLDSIDYSAGQSLRGLLAYLEARHIRAATAHLDPSLEGALQRYGINEWIPDERRYATLEEAVAAFGSRHATT